VVPEDDEAFPQAAAGLAAGCVAVVAVGFIAAGAFPAHDLMARAVALALVAGVAAALIDAWWSAAGVAVFAALVFVGFLAHRYGVLTGGPSAWPDTAVIASAALAGHAARRARAVLPAVMASARQRPGPRMTDAVTPAGHLVDGRS
jgi:hypothetical protein